MKIFFRNFTLCTILIAVSMFTGCGSKSEKLLGALKKNSEVNSYAFKSKVSMKIDSKDIQSGGIPQTIELDLSGKASQTKDKKIKKENYKLDMDVKAGSMGMSIDTKLLSETSIENNKVDFRFLAKIPEALKSQLPATLLSNPKISQSEYVYMDSKGVEKLNQIAKENGEKPSDYDISKASKSVANLSNSIYSFIEKYMKENDKEKDILTSKGKVEVLVNGENQKLDTYELKISNEGLKKFLKAYAKDEKNIQAIVNYLNSFAPQGDNIDKKDLKTKEILKNIDSISQIIDKNGIILDFSLKDGYVVKETFKGIFLMDGDKMDFNVSMELFNINKEDKITIPKKEQVKSLDIIELITNFLNFQPEKSSDS